LEKARASGAAWSWKRLERFCKRPRQGFGKSIIKKCLGKGFKKVLEKTVERF